MKERLRIYNGEIITPDTNIGTGTILVEDGKIKAVEKGVINVEGYQDVDAEGGYIMPGFIDIHTHGAGNHDFMDCTAEACKGIAKEHARHGTTMLFPTTLASGNEELFRFLEVYENVKDQTEGAAFGGLHLEGPYFSYAFRDAQDPRYLKNPSPEDYMPVLESGADIRRWSIAPELPGALELGRLLDKRGIIPSIAHTDAIYEDIVKAHEAGYSMMTHFYSCMNGVTRRNAIRYAGCIEAGYLIEDMILEIIGDGIHVPEPLLKLILKCKPVDKIVLCTDSMRGAGMPEGSKSILGSLTDGQEVLIEDGVAKMPDRTCFAGSVATTDRLVRTMHFIGGASLPDAVKMLTSNPATLMGYGDTKGKIRPGYDADIVICDKKLYAQQTYSKGHRIF